MFKVLCILSLIINVYSYTEAPIVGVLSQESFIVRKYFDEPPHSFIAASYVKYLESAGARVMPIWIGQDDDYYKRVVNYTNGILFPGGGTYFNETGGYGEAATKLYKLAIETNDKGVIYPLWGTCLGMQVIPFAELGEDIRISCNLKKVAVPLNFVEGFHSSRLFSIASDDIIILLKTKNVTYNFHQFCLDEINLKDHNILDEWRILSTNKDVNGLEFISSMEHRRYPFYGVQYHPEKNQFEFKRNVGIPHSPEAVRVAQYFANFFVDECRKNNHTFPDWKTEQEALIYNFQMTFTGLKNSSYEQLYVFSKNDTKLYQIE